MFLFVMLDSNLFSQERTVFTQGDSSVGFILTEREERERMPHQLAFYELTGNKTVRYFFFGTDPI